MDVPILRVSSNSTKALYDTYPGGYTPKYSMLVIKKWSWSECYEELGAFNLIREHERGKNASMCVEHNNIPFVFGPAFAMARIPAPTNRSSGWISSSLMRYLLARIDDRLRRWVLRTNSSRKYWFLLDLFLSDPHFVP